VPVDQAFAAAAEEDGDRDQHHEHRVFPLRWSNPVIARTT
jgi:hypothetical protein